MKTKSHVYILQGKGISMKIHSHAFCFFGNSTYDCLTDSINLFVQHLSFTLINENPGRMHMMLIMVAPGI